MGRWVEDGAYGKCGCGGEECDEVVCNEVSVCMRDRKLSWTSSWAIYDSRNVDIKSSQALSTRVEEAIGRQDVDQSKRFVSTNDGVLVRQRIGNGGHSRVGIGAFLVLEEVNALCVERRHFKCCV